MFTKKKTITVEPEPVVTSAPPVEEPAPITVPSADTAESALTRRLTDYVHHRLNQHLPSAVDFYVQELRDVFAGKS